MGVKTKDVVSIQTESAWSDGHKTLLCLKSGEWRTKRPIIEKSLCSLCGICEIFCPPQCIGDNGDYYVVNLEYCKGCGICAMECPQKAITMKTEREYADDCKIK